MPWQDALQLAATQLFASSAQVPCRTTARRRPGRTLPWVFACVSPQANPGRGERAYSDLEVIKELRAMSNANKRQEKVAPRVAGAPGVGCDQAPG